MTTSVSPSWVRGKVIGRGSYGSVSLGFDRTSGRIFAVKSVQLISHADAIDSLENEIRILSSLEHSPYVVEYLGNDFDLSHRNLHLELLPGGTVTDSALWRRRDGKLFNEDTLRLHTRCLVSALRHVHSRGIVHCDVKGRNVIVGEDLGIVKLADFGSAIRVGSESKPRGSPLWMAPEVVRGEYQGPASDVWSLGCTVIEMVTGRPVWEDRGAETLCRIGFSDEIPEFPSELSEHGRDFLEKCLRRDPNGRWSCDQLLQHPFMASKTAADSTIDSSPRCVLDWEFEEEFGSELDDGNTLATKMQLFTGAEQESCPRDRVRGLCHGGGASWVPEDGWEVVREAARLNAARDAYGWAGADDEMEAAERRASSEYCRTSGAGREKAMILPEYLNGGSGGREQVDGRLRGRSSCQPGTGKEVAQGDYCCLSLSCCRRARTHRRSAVVAAVVVGIYIYSLCNSCSSVLLLLLFSPYFLLAMFSRHYCCYNYKDNKEDRRPCHHRNSFWFLLFIRHVMSLSSVKSVGYVRYASRNVLIRGIASGQTNP